MSHQPTLRVVVLDSNIPGNQPTNQVTLSSSFYLFPITTTNTTTSRTRFRASVFLLKFKCWASAGAPFPVHFFDALSVDTAVRVCLRSAGSRLDATLSS